MNPISEINQWCQKTGNPLPKYTFEGDKDAWFCQMTADWLPGGVCKSNGFSNKKEAKSDLAQKVCKEFLTKIREFIIEPGNVLEEGPICLLIDGDQRMDCWKWLVSKDVIWPDKDFLKVRVYISPTTPLIECLAYERDIQVIKAKTTNKDSADAKILMDLGAFLTYQDLMRYVIVSSDHILVQAAEDNGLQWVGNLEGLKGILS